MWKDSIRNIVGIFQTNILRIIGFYVRRSATVFLNKIIEKCSSKVTSTEQMLKWLKFNT